MNHNHPAFASVWDQLKVPEAEARKYTDFRLMRDLFTVQTRRFPERTALYYREGEVIRQVSFEELRQSVFSLGGWLWSQGWHHKHIAIVAKNSYPYIVLLWAILCGDNTGVLVDYRLSEEELCRRLELSDANVVFCDAESAPRLAGCGLPMIMLETLDERFVWDGSERNDYEAYEPDAQAAALMLFSSGTTGRSKAVMISQQAFAEGARLIQKAIALTRDFLLPLPLFHIMSLISLFSQHIGFGLGMFIHNDNRRLLADIAYIKPETILLVPAQMEVFHKMVQAHGAEATRAILGGNLRFIYTGGASLKADVTDSMEQLGITILSGYGMTEVMIVAPANDLVNRRGAAGYPAPSVELRIDRPDANGSGEILIRGNTLFSGYYKDPVSTAASFTEDGWFRSGDIGHFDDDGYLYVTGRKKNIIILGSGENVCPEELEELLLRSGLISDCRVCEYEEAICAEIIPEERRFSQNTDIQTIEQQLRSCVRDVNASLPSSHQINRVMVRYRPFERSSGEKLRRDIPPAERPHMSFVTVADRQEMSALEQTAKALALWDSQSAIEWILLFREPLDAEDMILRWQPSFPFLRVYPCQDEPEIFAKAKAQSDHIVFLQPGEQPSPSGAVSALPQTGEEQCLYEVMTEVLGTNQIDMTATFGQMGGDSIRSMMVSARLKERNLRLQGISLYSNSSLREVAAHLMPAESSQNVPMNGLPREDIPEDSQQLLAQLADGEDNIEAVFYLPFEQRFFYDRLKAAPDSGAYNVTSLQLVPVAFTEESFRERAQAVVRCHAALRSIVVETDFGLSYQTVLKEREVSCFYKDLRHLADGETVPSSKQTAFYQMYMNFYAHSAKDLAQALIPHFVCFRVSDNACVLGYSCTHAFIDGWSDNILIREFTAPQEPLQADRYVPYFMARYHKKKTEDIRFWVNYLQGVKLGNQVIPMETSWREGTMRQMSAHLGRDLSERLLTAWKPRNVSVSMLMQYLFGLTLCELLDKDELLLMITFACRGAEVDREDEIIGNLTRMYPLRCGRQRSLSQYRDDLRAAEEHTAPSTAEIFGSAGIWGDMLNLQLTTDILPGHEHTTENSSFSLVNMSRVRDNLLGTALQTMDGLGFRLEYNDRMLNAQQVAVFEKTMIALAESLLTDAQQGK